MPRKTFRYHSRMGSVRIASMRPRPDAAENAVLSYLASGSPPASMRPRPDAAENRPQATVTADTWQLQ